MDVVNQSATDQLLTSHLGPEAGPSQSTQPHIFQDINNAKLNEWSSGLSFLGGPEAAQAGGPSQGGSSLSGLPARRGPRPPPTAALAALVAGVPVMGPDAAQAALLDPKRAKRILANRQSAARSKERKMRYITELERRVSLLQSEANTLTNQYQGIESETFALEAEKSQLETQLTQLEKEISERDGLNISLQEKISMMRAEMETKKICGEDSSNPADEANSNMDTNESKE
mmetsp:Transcript_17454/g.24115  ORF Transcript_17454/g.24115 Transcript_17454/m.24115 type:complete len:230 (+) Transcript_17454:201-890(+)|eukprot:CAMPEP_0196579176 /NCGR_PEP_ID=MMETSP1081-20130531/18135_1 /TAXON_ID=36882 /ORGANISM="Pyramimonas amylifera, Strain CCMP720" /LENGTH=229 /DNA_ID=CAMNT_0041898653 /DNA_START=199 /DNA_END=888 /DNA_ORIENTATION=-